MTLIQIALLNVDRIIADQNSTLVGFDNLTDKQADKVEGMINHELVRLGFTV